MTARQWKNVCWWVALGCVAGAASAASTGTTDSVAMQWNAVALQAVRDTHPGPPICARELAIVSTCMYDAWAPYDSLAVGTRPGDPPRRPVAERTQANKEKAISFAAYSALVDLFPQQAEKLKCGDLMAQLGYDPTDGSTDTSTASGIGNVAAAKVLEFRHRDGSNQLGDLSPSGVPYADYTTSDYTAYVPVNPPEPAPVVDPNHWQPLRVSDGRGGFVIQKYIAPQWGQVIPFALTSPSQFRPATGPARWNGTPESSPEYVQQAEELLNFSANLTDEQKTIVEYWADGPGTEQPPGHWCLFAQYVSQQHQYGLDSDVKLLFTLTNALMDAGIVAWDAKRVYDSVRPITAIHYLFKGQKVKAWVPFQGTQEIDGEKWQPYQISTLVTPAFPEYISGHSTFSAAAAEVLKCFTDDDTFGLSVTLAPGSSPAEPGVVPKEKVTLTWATFSDAADQAGMSRRYGGIHFKDGDLEGRLRGRIVGLAAWDKALTYFYGIASPGP